MKSDQNENAEYSNRVIQQIQQFKGGNQDVLPSAFHYWSQNHIAPKLKSVFGTFYIYDIFRHLLLGDDLNKERHYHFASLGSGDCENVEIRLAQSLKDAGVTTFKIDCYELSDGLRARAAIAIEAAGLSAHFNLIGGDINQNPLQRCYDGIMAHHSLHHFVNLEGIFDEVNAKLANGGTFAVYDIIGRNGHMRWPEIELLVRKIWGILPVEKKYNHQLREVWDNFVNLDCSASGFEGIRAQDILPALLSRFQFSHCVAFGGLIDVFVDRGFGHNFDPSDQADRAFIDMLEYMENILIDGGVIKPTIMFAGLTKHTTACRYNSPRSPIFCLRPPTVIT